MGEGPRLGKTLDETQDVEKLPLGTVLAAEHNGECGAVDRTESAKRDADALSISHPSTRSVSPDQARETEEHTRSKSKSASVRSKAVTIIPRSKRRGLLGRLALIPEVSHPPEYARKTKWLITLIVALAAAAAPMGSAILFRESIHGSQLDSLSLFYPGTDCFSYSATVVSRVACLIHGYESFCCFIYACHVYIPVMVVFIF